MGFLMFPTYGLLMGLRLAALRTAGAPLQLNYHLAVRGIKTPETGMKHFQFYSNNFFFFQEVTITNPAI